jgi:5-methylthioadenosine/S-adenosylhomocysteine deaminase
VTQDGPRRVDLIITAGLVITVDSTRRSLRDASIVVDHGVIQAVDSAAAIEGQYSARKTLDARGDVVTPGLIDGHVHLSHHLMRTSIPDAWPESREHDVWLPYWRNLTEDDAYHSAMLACLEMVRNGTTSFCDMSGRYTAEIQAAAAEAVGMRGIVSETCWDRPPVPEVGVGDTDRCVERLESVIKRFPRTPDRRIWAAVGMSGMGKCSDALVSAGSDLARRSGLVFYMHQSFGKADTNTFRESSGGRLPTEHLAELGVLGPELQLVHMIRTERPEVDLLAREHVNVVHCPGASMRWGMGASRGHFPEMVAAGVNVSLGSDSGNYSDFFDIGRQAYLAATMHREARGVTPTITAEQAFEMATINGARTLGIEDMVGSIEVGKRADLVVHDGSRPSWHPVHDPAASFVYAAQTSGVRDVVIDGEVVLDHGQFTRLDAASALAAIDDAARDLFGRMDLALPHPWPIDSRNAKSAHLSRPHVEAP